MPHDSVFKTISFEDRQQYKTYVNQYMFLSGAQLPKPIDHPREDNNQIQYHEHQYFYSVYDNPWLSGSARKIYDISFFVDPQMNNSPSGSDVDHVYFNNLDSGSLKSNTFSYITRKTLDIDFLTKQQKRFELHDDGVFGPRNIYRGWAITFARNLVQDGIKPGTFRLINSNNNVIVDYANENYQPSVLSQSAISGKYNPILDEENGTFRGLIFYDLGMVILEPEHIPVSFLTSSGIHTGSVFGSTNDYVVTGSQDFILKTGMNAIESIQFENEVEVQTGIFNCKIGSKDFNYSSNPSYFSGTSGSRISIKKTTQDKPVSYFTSVGLYSDNNELLAIAKLSKPIKKTTEDQQTIRVRLDF